MSLTLLTNPFASAFPATNFAIRQLFHSAAPSLSRTISPTLQFLLMVFCFCQHWNVARTSFLHLLQNSLEIFCNLLQYLQHQMCDAAKGAGGMTFGFNFNRFIGLSGTMLLTSPNKSIVKSHEFTTPSTSIRKACNDSSDSTKKV